MTMHSVIILSHRTLLEGGRGTTRDSTGKGSTGGSSQKYNYQQLDLRFQYESIQTKILSYYL